MEGTYRKDRHVDPVDIAPGVVVPPPELSEDARVVWDRYIQPRVDAGFYTEPAEAPLLGQWCQWLIVAYQAQDVIPPGGVYESEDPYGRPKFTKHPGVTAAKEASAEFRALSARLGLDPLARMQVADLVRGAGESGVGPQLPEGAPPAWTPRVLSGDDG